MNLQPLIPENWKEYFQGAPLDEVSYFLSQQNNPWQPAYPNIFRFAQITNPSSLKAVIIGQDPYPGAGVATGLAFDASTSIKTPASLRNIFKEYHADLGYDIPTVPSLEPWASQGVLLINATLTVDVGAAGSHSKHSHWQEVTDCLLRHINEKHHSLAFLLWGSFAQSKASLIDQTKHAVISSNHPSPLSASRGPVPFIGSRPFSAVNDYRSQQALEPINWQL